MAFPCLEGGGRKKRIAKVEIISYPRAARCRFFDFRTWPEGSAGVIAVCMAPNLIPHEFKNNCHPVLCRSGNVRQQLLDERSCDRHGEIQ